MAKKKINQTINKLQKVLEEDDILFDKNDPTHKVWYKFQSWLHKTYASDITKKKKWTIDGKTIYYNDVDEEKLQRRLVGYAVQNKIEKYVKRFCPEIKIVHCDDELYASSIILLIPHPSHGITVMFIPQCTGVQNRFFMYENHFSRLTKELDEMKKVYKARKHDRKR